MFIFQVVSKGQSDGPAGVTLTLTKQGSTEVIKEAQSEVGGGYKFEKVLPGEYAVTARHPSWTFDQVRHVYCYTFSSCFFSFFLFFHFLKKKKEKKEVPIHPTATPETYL